MAVVIQEGGAQMGHFLDRRTHAFLLTVSTAFALSAPAFAQEASSYGRVAVTIKQNGSASSGTFEVHARGGAIVASGHAGLPARVPAGTYDVVVRLDGAIDRPERWVRAVVVRPGGTVNVEQSFQTSILEVRVFSRGRRAAATIYVRRAGESANVATLGAGVRAVISAGTYDIVVRHRATERVFSGIELVAGRARTLTADFDQGS
jgi:hypothetical protein